MKEFGAVNVESARRLSHHEQRTENLSKVRSGNLCRRTRRPLYPCLFETGLNLLATLQ